MIARTYALADTLATDEDRKAKIANTRTGEVRILANKDYENIISERELEVLRLIDQVWRMCVFFIVQHSFYPYFPTL